MHALVALLPLLAVASAQDVLLTSTPPSAAPPCLQAAYHGVYGGEHVFLPEPACVPSLGLLDSGALVPRPGGQIVWVGPAGVEGSGRGVGAMRDAYEATARTAALRGQVTGDAGQVVFGTGAGIELLHASDSGMFLSVPDALVPVLDTLLPPHVVPVAVSPYPLPASTPATLAYDIPEHYAKHLANITEHLRFDPAINSVVASLDAERIARDITYLTGEREDSDIESRHSFSPGARKAAAWIKDQVEATGASCSYFDFLPGFAPDVICTYPSVSNSTERVILSGHYDSRGTFGSVRMPGADDDGSGSGHVLAVARAIHEHAVEFDKSVTLAFFAGEEQGLLGSYGYAKHLAEKNATVLLQVQADMLAYRVPGEPLQMGLPESIELPEAGTLLASLAQLYAPELVVGRTAACCSDHQSFLAWGFPASQVFERAGWIADPQYHQSGDVTEREGYDFEQVVSIAKVTLAAVLEVGGGIVPERERDE